MILFDFNPLTKLWKFLSKELSNEKFMKELKAYEPLISLLVYEKFLFYDENLEDI